ncbi:MAG: sigma-70 family RNA polymerase sigma factor [Verrucomicrobia bacterium]|nr:sigma-70 family RNA polymerase sigma factor [Verrucomicrobiota bacterium]
MDDRDLIIRARTGDLDAFSELVKRYQANVRACLAVRLHAKHEAEDLAQDAFIVAYRKLDEFDEEKSFGPWIRTIAFNLLRNHWRKHKAIPMGGAAELEMLIDKQVALRYSDKNESNALAALKLCVEKLDEPMRKLVALRYIEGLPVSKLTKMMKVHHSTMTMRLHRIRTQLRGCMGELTETFET